MADGQNDGTENGATTAGEGGCAAPATETVPAEGPGTGAKPEPITLGPDSPFACPECGRACSSKRGLGVHRRFEHGVRSPVALNAKRTRGQRRGDKRGRRTAKAASVGACTTPRRNDLPGVIREMFARVGGDMAAMGAVLDACVKGYAGYVVEMKRWRLNYMRHAVTIKKLNAKVAALRIFRDAEDRAGNDGSEEEEA